MIIGILFLLVSVIWFTVTVAIRNKLFTAPHRTDLRLAASLSLILCIALVIMGVMMIATGI